MIEERISDAEDSIENIDSTVREKCKMQKAYNPKHPGNPGHNEKTKPKDIGINESKHLHL